MFKIVDFNRKSESEKAIVLILRQQKLCTKIDCNEILSWHRSSSCQNACSFGAALSRISTQQPLYPHPPTPPTCPLISAAPPLTRIRASIQSGIGGEHMMSRRVRAGERSSYFVSRGIVQSSQQPFNRTIQSLLFELKRKVNIDVQNLKACHVYRREQELCLVSIHQHSDDRLNSREIPFNSFL